MMAYQEMSQSDFDVKKDTIDNVGFLFGTTSTPQPEDNNIVTTELRGRKRCISVLRHQLELATAQKTYQEECVSLETQDSLSAFHRVFGKFGLHKEPPPIGTPSLLLSVHNTLNCIDTRRISEKIVLTFAMNSLTVAIYHGALVVNQNNSQGLGAFGIFVLLCKIQTMGKKFRLELLSN